jgi:hypothetical protein
MAEGLFSLVGRTRFELVTNGLKVLCAGYAKPAVIGEAVRMDCLEVPFLPTVGRKVPHQKHWMGAHLYKIAVVNVSDHRDNRASPFTHAFQAPKTGTVVAHRERSSERAFAFLRRCLVGMRRVVVRHGSALADRLFCGYLLESASHAAPYTAGCVRGLAGSTPAVPTKHRHSSGRELTQHMGLNGPHPPYTGPDDQSDAPTRTWQGYRVKVHA